MAQRPLERIGAISPPAVELYTKIIQVSRSDTTAFDAFVFPKGALLAGVYSLGQVNSDAGTAGFVSVGTNPGTTDEILAQHNVKTDGRGYQVVKNAAGTLLGSIATSDLAIKARYNETGAASTTGGPWLIKVEYYFPQSGQPW